jgi:hypothetical protein
MTWFATPARAPIKPEQEAEADTESLFPGGSPSAEQFVYVVEVDGEPVFGGNEVARGLYLSLGYDEVAVEMAKAVPT